MSSIELEFDEFDKSESWAIVYQRFRNEVTLNHEFTYSDAKAPEFRNRNRYRDVSPYDHSRVRLQRDDLDYINANLIVANDAGRKYILTQGPLPHTSGHFWLMVWEQNSKAVLMLNRIIEKGTLKCHQYFPTGIDSGGQDELLFPDVDLKVCYIQEQDRNYYTVRTLLLEDLRTGSTKEVHQFHYISWPDFGVPQSPAAFLKFLLAVRQSGALEENVGPPVIHCSAGIGRSGTFCLVDTCLVLIQKNKSMDNIDVRSILANMRQYRMGLIQTADQLRFSYQAIIEGGQAILEDPDSSIPYRLQNGDDNDNELISINSKIEAEKPPPLPSKQNPQRNRLQEETTDRLTEGGMGIRRRDRGERKRQTAEQIDKMKKKLQDSEKWQKRRSQLKPVYIGLSLAVIVGGYLLYKYYF